MLFVVHWGVVTAYLPQRAEAAGANIGLFFAADGLFVLLARLPAGWLADRTRPIWPLLIGIAMTAFAVLMLFPAPTTPILIVSGTLTGIGAALIVIPILLALTERSGDADRGSAFALFSASFAAAIALASIGTAPFIEALGFESILAAAFIALLLAGAISLLDRDMRTSRKVA
jgi:predicted MFS family arabinose efflux permease